MSIKSVSPYLYFAGRAAEAITHYERALGAQIVAKMLYGEVNGSCPDADKGRVLHAMLKLGEASLMLSDTSSDELLSQGSNVQVSIDFAEVAELENAFAELAFGGSVKLAPQDTFWGARFGTLVDKFGVYWMFNCQLKKA